MTISKIMESCKRLAYLGIFVLAWFASILINVSNQSHDSIKIRSLFTNFSAVEEWHVDEISSLEDRISCAEFSIVLFYTTWDVESHLAARSFEEVAKRFYTKVKFVAVNCYQHSRFCQYYFKRDNSWPVIVAFHGNYGRMMYESSFSYGSLAKFTEGLLNPMYKISNLNDLARLLYTSSAVVIGHFSSKHDKEKVKYFYTATRWVANDPFQDVKFAVSTMDISDSFNQTTPAITFHAWNQTRVYEGNIMNFRNLIEWIKRNLHIKNTWLNLPGKKSSLLSSHLSLKPSILIFTKTNSSLANFGLYLMAKMSSLSCSRVEPFISKKNDTFGQLKSENKHNTKESSDKSRDIKLKRMDSCRFNKYENIDVGTTHATNFTVSYMTRNSINIEDVARHRKSIYNSAWKEVSQTYFNNGLVDPVKVLSENICAENSNFSILLLDSSIYGDILYNIGINDSTETSILVDNENESLYRLDELSYSALSSFVVDFHQKNTQRFKGRKQNNTRNFIKSEKISSLDIDSKQFTELLEFSNKTLVILFYSSQCSLCSLTSQKLLKFYNIFQNSEIDYFRIDGEKNDLSWEYEMGAFPLIAIFPKNQRSDTIFFPQSLQQTERNILGFLLSNLPRLDRIKMFAKLCINFRLSFSCENCIIFLRKQVLKCISEALQKWKHFPLNRDTIFQNIQKLQQLYMLTLQEKNACNLQYLKDLILLLQAFI